MSETKTRTDSWIMLRDVRIAFCQDLFEAKQYEGDGPYRYGSSFLVVPGSPNDKAVRDAIERAGIKAWGEKWLAIKKGIEGQNQKWSYLDGDTKDYDGFPGNWVVSAKRGQKKGPVKVIDRDTRELTEKEGRIYGGCVVNAKIDFWGQKDGKGAPGMRCTLIGVQFSKDGEAFSGAAPASAEGFDPLEGGDADDLI